MTQDRRNQGGYAMLVVLMVMMVLFLLGMAMLALAGNSKRDVTRQREQVQAYYAAEAGVEKILARAAGDWDWLAAVIPTPYLQDVPFAGGSIVFASITKQAVTGGFDVIIESKGHFGDSNRTVTVRARVLRQPQVTLSILSWQEKYGVF